MPTAPRKSTKQAPGRKPTRKAAKAKSVDRAASLASAFDSVPSALLLADRDLKITHANRRSLELLRELREFLPVDPDEIIGQNVDIFHKDPSHQRRLLANEKNLPHAARFKVGDFAIELDVKAVRDDAGEWLATLVSWDIVNAQLELESKNRDYEGQIEAIKRSQAVIEFDLEGNILEANDNFLQVTGYSADEVVGNHHRMFVDPDYAASAEYAKFWADLRNGVYRADEFKRFGKGGNEIWIQATYNPILGQDGKPYKVVKFASEVTAQKQEYADFRGQLDAISKSQAVIEFTLDGNILTANDNFLSATGYRLEEIQGRHHSMFVGPEHAASNEYRLFWEQLNRGEFVAGEFERVRKGGEPLWIQASYNPIFDLNGKPCKVVKYAADITAAKELEAQVQESREREQRNAEEQRRKVAELLTVVNTVADGDLAVEMPDFGEDAIGQVARGVDKAVAAIRGTLLQVQEVAGTVATSAREMATASDQISNGAQTQASSLEETAASLEEITSTVKQNTDNSQQAQQLSISSRDVAQQGGDVVTDAIDAMTAIEGSSKRISEIITTIDEIAFQTNLLALNAAVEAARAGEQGRGFAVVASEVRNLAQRSANAAKEIKGLIQDSVSKVENGTTLVNKSGETLQEIVTSVKRVTDIVTEISAASSEQLTGVEQVNTAVAQMDRVTQGNAAQTEEMAGTSQSLLSHAEQLRQLVSAFRLGQNAAEFAQNPQPAPAATPSTNWQSPAASTGNGVAHELDLIGSGATGGDFVEF